MDAGEVGKSLPFNYEVEIENFWTMKDAMDIYKSAVFEAGGFKWKLVFHPNGNRRKNVTDDLSFYLAMAERVELGWEVNAVVNFYLKNYQFPAGSEPQGERRFHFHPLKLENGFDKFIKLYELNKHLQEKERGSCTFGVAVVSVQPEQRNGRAERLSMSEEAPATYTWKIHKFSSKLNQECLDSELFGDENRKWKIQLYPKKKETGQGTDVRICLALANPTSFASTTSRIYVKVTLRTQVLDKAKCKHTTTVKDWFSGSSPKQELVTFGVPDILEVEAEVRVLGTVDAIP